MTVFKVGDKVEMIAHSFWAKSETAVVIGVDDSEDETLYYGDFSGGQQNWCFEECDATLVEEKLRYDWSETPDNVNWIGTDSDGDIRGFDVKPVSTKHNWYRGDGHPVSTHLNIAGDYPPPCEGWRDTLEQRPVVEVKVEPATTIYEWREVPEDFNWIAEDEDGEVYAYEFEPEILTSVWDGDGEMDKIGGDLFEGDWKDSLEARPIGLSVPAIDHGEPVDVDPDVQVDEWVDGLPSIGIECMVLYSGDWHETFIAGIDSNGSRVFETNWEDSHCFDAYSKDLAERFKPLQTAEEIEADKAFADKEKAVNEMLDVVGRDLVDVIIICRELYDANYRKC